MAQEKAGLQQGESSRGEKHLSSSQRPPISLTSKKSKKKDSVLAGDQFDAHKFVDLQATRLYKALGKARTSGI